LWRDLARLKGQLITIALVVAAGIAAFVTLRGSYSSLQNARAHYYGEQRFADVFIQLERAPNAVAEELEGIEGIARVETRIVHTASVQLPDMRKPARAQVVSLSGEGERSLNAPRVVRGRMIDRTQDDEVLLLQAFAGAHGLEPGDSLPMIIEGQERRVQIVGLAISPEYVFVLPPDGMSNDPGSFAVVWMEWRAAEAAAGMAGAFNDVAARLQRGASEAAVIDALDRALEPYGGLGAHGRARQPSNQLLEGELTQLEGMSTTLPITFLAVAALLLHIVLSRLVHLQRPEIATLKAVGYSDLRIGIHFLQLVLVISVAGALAGVGLGAWLGGGMINLYKQFFAFPELRFAPGLGDAGVAVAISFAAACVGALSAVRKVAKLPPAEAMRPEAPTRYRRSLLDQLRIGRLAGPSANMVVRELERHPFRTLLSSLAIASSVALMVVGGWYYDGIEMLMYTQFHRVMREDVSVTFVRPVPERAARSLQSLDGVLTVEGMRVVPVQFVAGHRTREGSIFGYPDGIEMRGLRDRLGNPVEVPADGVVLSAVLGDILGVKVGDRVDAVLREGDRSRKSLAVTGLVDDSFGLQGIMRLETLRDWLQEGPVVSMALLRVDPQAAAAVDAELKDMPGVAGFAHRADALRLFREQSASMLLAATFIISLFAATITVGVVYNNARVALSLRARDLASLRVLGFHNHEVSAILLGEMAVQVLLALPLGLWMGKGLVIALASTVDPETFRLPIILTPRSYALAATIALAASIASGLLVRRKVNRLDLIGVLKTRE
jgi:putative ABC transport system permease protein